MSSVSLKSMARTSTIQVLLYAFIGTMGATGVAMGYFGGKVEL